MENHINMIIDALKRNDITVARKKLSLVVGRNTEDLDEQHIISGAIESIADSTVDGIISPIFYFSVFGSSGPFIFRVINTLDSMIGYRDLYFINIGWMAAKLDTYANYIPSRITSLFIIISSLFIKADWRNSIEILKRDRHHAVSVNSGYPMSAMAGALKVRLEKINYYQIGIPREELTIEKCTVAIKIMKISTVLFCLSFSIPLILLLGITKWWSIIFGF
jgi:adenosylcobinamide-phosphate synthase